MAATSYLVKAAEVARRRMLELAAWQALEEGKQWAQAYNDMAEDPANFMDPRAVTEQP